MMIYRCPECGSVPSVHARGGITEIQHCGILVENNFFGVAVHTWKKVCKLFRLEKQDLEMITEVTINHEGNVPNDLINLKEDFLRGELSP